MIHERGFWMDKAETDTHLFDEDLCKKIAKVFNGISDTIIDVGCGNGAYTFALREAGFKCEGFDGSPLTLEITNGECNVLDFSRPVELGKYDLVLSLEVGEHIPAEYEKIFIQNLCDLANDFIVLSWATEGQLGTGHVNCRNNEYVIDKLERHGFKYIPNISNDLRKASTLPWFKNTLMVFSKW